MKVTFYRPKAIAVGWPPQDEDREPIMAVMPAIPHVGDEVHIGDEAWQVKDLEWRIEADGQASVRIGLE